MTRNLLAALALLTACADPSANPSSTSVDDLLLELPAWDQFAPPEQDQRPQPVEGAEVIEFEEAITYETITDEDADGDGIADIEILEDVVSICTSVPYTMTDTPERIVMYSPDVELLWPGALLQGKSHRDGLGSLLPLPIAERSPLEVSIPGFSTGDNFRTVADPTQALVSSAIGDIVGNAVASDLQTPSTITFEEKTYHSESEFALSFEMSGRYLNFEGSAEGSTNQSGSRTTVTAQFFEKMFEVVVAPPSTPAGFFSDAFTAEKYQQQEELGRVGPDNLPIYVSNVVYGRMMTFSLTSTASESEIRATLSAAYDGLVAEVEASLSAKQKAILAESTISISSLGGSQKATAAMIRSGNWQEYFDQDMPLSAAAPLSYTFRNLGDNSIASVAESTEFNITTCKSRAQGELFDFAEVTTHETPIDLPFDGHAGDFNGDGIGDVLWNHRTARSNQLYIGFGSEDGELVIGEAQEHPVSDALGGWGNYEVHVGDVDGDGVDDVVWNRLDSSNTWFIARFDADGMATFDAGQEASQAGWGSYQADIGDVDGDQRADMVFAYDRRVYAATGFTVEGGLTMQPHQDFAYDLDPYDRGPIEFQLADYDGDGDADLIVSRTYTVESFLYIPTAWVALANGGPFSEPQLIGSYGAWFDPHEVELETGRFTDEGISALLFDDEDTGDTPSAVVMQEDADATLAEGSEIPEYNLFERVIGDVNGDGRDDVVWNRLDGGSNTVAVSFGRNDEVSLDSELQVHPWPVRDWETYNEPVMSDVNGDGREDLVWIQPGPDAKVHIGLASEDL